MEKQRESFSYVGVDYVDRSGIWLIFRVFHHFGCSILLFARP